MFWCFHSLGWRNWALFTGLTPSKTMTQSENSYRQDVFLNDLRHQKDRHQLRIWAEHQQMQLSFLKRRGLISSSTVLDLGCGPMRLGSALIPLLKKGWYWSRHQFRHDCLWRARCCASPEFLSRRPTRSLLLTNSISA